MRRLMRLAPDIIARDYPDAGEVERAYRQRVVPLRGEEPAGAQALSTLLPPDFHMPPEATYVYAQANASVAGAGSWTVPAAIQRVIPNGSVGVIRLFAVSVLNMVTTTDITWRLRINGGSVPGLGAVGIVPRAAAYVEQETPTLTIRAPEGSLVDVLITVNDVATYTVGARYEGWYYPRGVAERYLKGRVG